MMVDGIGTCGSESQTLTTANRDSRSDARIVPSCDATVHHGMRVMPKPGPVEETESVGRDSADRTPGLNAVRKQPAIKERELC